MDILNGRFWNQSFINRIPSINQKLTNKEKYVIRVFQAVVIINRVSKTEEYDKNRFLSSPYNN